MFLLVQAYPGSPGQKADKRLCVCVKSTADSLCKPTLFCGYCHFQLFVTYDWHCLQFDNGRMFCFVTLCDSLSLTMSDMLTIVVLLPQIVYIDHQIV